MSAGNYNIWPSDEEIERAAETLIASCAQREIGHFPVDDESRDIARWMLTAANEAHHGETWNPLPYRVTSRESSTGSQK